jgi:hypothetical protein
LILCKSSYETALKKQLKRQPFSTCNFKISPLMVIISFISLLLALFVSAQIVPNAINCNCASASFSYNSLCYCDAQATLVINCMNQANPQWSALGLPGSVSVPGLPGSIPAPGLSGISNINSCSSNDPFQNPAGFQQCIQQNYPQLTQACININAQQDPNGYQQCIQTQTIGTGSAIGATNMPITPTIDGITNINSCSTFNVQQNPTGFQQCIQQNYPQLTQTCLTINVQQNPNGYQQCIQTQISSANNNGPTSAANQQIVNCISQTGARSTSGQVGINNNGQFRSSAKSCKPIVGTVIAFLAASTF